MIDVTGGKVVVIGGAGLIGSNTVNELLKEDVAEIVIYDNLSRGRMENLEAALRDPRVRPFDVGGDVLLSDVLQAAVEGAVAVFNFAALGLLYCQDYPRAAFDVNIRGAFNVLEACRNAGVKRLIYSSAASVYGEAVEEPMTEDHPLNTTTFYGACKVAAEFMSRAFYHRYGLGYVALRYMNVYGPGAAMGVLMNMLDAIHRGEPPVVYGAGDQAYDFVYVSDCARANVLAMKSDAVDQCYNIGTGTRTSIKELAELLIEVTGADTGVRYEPGGVTLVRNRIGSTDLARKDLGFDATVPLEEGLRGLVEWYRRRLGDRRAGTQST